MTADPLLPSARVDCPTAGAFEYRSQQKAGKKVRLTKTIPRLTKTGHVLQVLWRYFSCNRFVVLLLCLRVQTHVVVAAVHMYAVAPLRRRLPLPGRRNAKANLTGDVLARTHKSFRGPSNYTCSYSRAYARTRTASPERVLSLVGVQPNYNSGL